MLGLKRFFSKRSRVLHKIESQYRNSEAYFIAVDERERLGLDPYAFVYGEVFAETVLTLLEAVQPKPGDVFYDLGSGSGKAVATVSVFYPEVKARGVELLAPMCELSQRLFDELRSVLSGMSLGSAEFIQSDLLDYPLEEADIVFVNATGFFGDALDRLVERLETTRPGTRILISSKTLPKATFEELRYFEALPMSWGLCQATAYVRSGEK